MVSKKRRHTHKTSINNSLNNSRSKKPRRIYRGGATPEEEAAATAAALALTGSAPPTQPSTPTDDTLQQEIVDLKKECNDALEKTKAAALTAQQAAQAATAAATAAAAGTAAAGTAAATAATAGTAAEAAEISHNNITISSTKEQIELILTEIKGYLTTANTNRNIAIAQANIALQSNLTTITDPNINQSQNITNFSDENGQNERINIKKPGIEPSDTPIFIKADTNIGYHASVYNFRDSVKEDSIHQRKKLSLSEARYGVNPDMFKNTIYRFRIYNWENPLVLPFYDDTRQTPITIDNYFEMITRDGKNSELIVSSNGPNIDVHNSLLTIELKDTMNKQKKYKIGRRRVFTKLSGGDNKYSRKFYDQIIIRDVDSEKEFIKQLKRANKHNDSTNNNIPYIDFRFNIKDLVSFNTRDVEEWNNDTGRQLLKKYFETKKADNESKNIYNEYSALNASSNPLLMEDAKFDRIFVIIGKILDELDKSEFKSMIQQGNYRKFQAANGSELINQEIIKMREEFENRRKYYTDQLNLKRRGETFSASIKNVGSGSDPALSAKLDKLEKKVNQLKEEKEAGDARLDDRTGVMVYTMPPGSTIKRNARPQQSFDEQVMNFMQMIKGSQLTSANKGIIRLIHETSKLYDSIEDEIIKADEIFLKMKGDTLGIDIAPVPETQGGTIVISNSTNKLKKMNPVNINSQGNARDTLSRFLQDLDEIFKNLARDVARIVANKKDIIEKIRTININFQSGGADINDLIPKTSAQERLEKINDGLSEDIEKSKIDILAEPSKDLKDADLKTKIKDEYNKKIDEIKTKYDEFKKNIEYMTLIINDRLNTPTSGGARKTRIRNRVRANTHSRKRHGIHKFKNRLYSGGAEPGESSTVDGNLASLQNKLDTENSPIPPPESKPEEPKPEEPEESKPDESEESNQEEEESKPEDEESKPDESEESKPDESEESNQEEEPKPDDEESKPDESEESKPEDEDKEDEESKPEDEDKEDEDKEDEDKEDEDKEDEDKDKEDEEKEEELKPENESKEDEESGEQELGEDEDKPEEEKEEEEKEEPDQERESEEDKEPEVDVTGMGSAIESMQGDLEKIDKSIDETQDSLTKAIELINDGQKDVKQGDLEEGNKKIDDGSQMLERIARQLENSKDDLKKSITDMDSNLLQQLDNRLGNIEEILGKVKAGEQVSEDDVDSNETNVKKPTQKDDDDDIADNCVKICSQEEQDDYLNDQMSMMNPAMMQQGMNNPMAMNPMMQQGMMMNPMMQQGMMMNPMMQQGMMMNPMMQQGMMNNPMMMNPMMQQGMMMNPMMNNPMMNNPMMMNPMMMNPQFMYNNPYLYQNQPIMNPMMENPRNNNNMFNSTRSRQYRPPRDSKTRKNRDFTGVDKANDESPTIEESENE